MAQSGSQSDKDAINITKAKEKVTTKEKPDNSYFGTSFSYLTNTVYNGRQDSLSTTSLTPVIGYFNKSGFYLTGSLSYIHSVSESSINLFALSTGYNFTIIKDKLTGGISAGKNYYNSGSTTIKSDEKGGIGANLNYDLDFISLSFGTDVLFTTGTDISGNFSLAHEFKIEGENATSWALTPTASVDMSTLNFYEAYTNSRIGKNAKKRNANINTVTSVTTITSHNGFTVLDYGFQLPIVYEAKTWGVSFTPQLALPINPILTTTTTTYTYKKNNAPLTETVNSTPEAEKNLKPAFCFELAVHYNLFTKHAKDE